MAKNTLPVVAAIPNYNMGESLYTLLPQVLEQDYNAVYVLDDASTDNSVDIARSYGRRQVQVIAGQKNVGSGANRNRVLDSLGRDAIIHFLDADVRLETDRMVERVRDAYHETQGLTGGLVLDSAGKQHLWNYGPRQCFYTDAGAVAHIGLALVGSKSPVAERIGRRLLQPIIKEWPNPLEIPRRHNVFWVVEANMLVYSALLRKVGGFDPNLRDHDVQDLAMRTQREGLKTVFDPSFAVTHTDYKNVRTGNRQTEMWKAELYIARKNGLRHWFLPDGRLKPRYNQ